MTRAQLQARLREEVVKQMAMSHQLDATRKLHEAAAMMANNPLCESYREQIHNLIDLQLDTTMAIAVLTRQMFECQD
jgi:hypothetical protein